LESPSGRELFDAAPLVAVVNQALTGIVRPGEGPVRKTVGETGRLRSACQEYHNKTLAME
jgi:hypothetical protein